MKLSVSMRRTFQILILSALLYVVWQFVGIFSFEYITLQTLSILIIICFLAVALYYLSRNKTIPKLAFTFIVLISTLSFLAILAFAAAFAFDVAGATCTGLFGTKTSCLFIPELILTFTLFNEMSIVALGVLSVFGIFNLLLPQFKKMEK